MVILSRGADEAQLWRLVVARSWQARLRGLIGRRSLEPGEGMYLPGTNGVHMLFMRFAIDCVFLGQRMGDGSRTVVAVRKNLAPWTGIVWWVRGAHGAIEIAAGEASRAGIRPGDTVVLDDAPRRA